MCWKRVSNVLSEMILVCCLRSGLGDNCDKFRVNVTRHKKPKKNLSFLRALGPEIERTGEVFFLLLWRYH